MEGHRLTREARARPRRPGNLVRELRTAPRSDTRRLFVAAGRVTGIGDEHGSSGSAPRARRRHRSQFAAHTRGLATMPKVVELTGGQASEFGVDLAFMEPGSGACGPFLADVHNAWATGVDAAVVAGDNVGIVGVGAPFDVAGEVPLGWPYWRGRRGSVLVPKFPSCPLGVVHPVPFVDGGKLLGRWFFADDFLDTGQHDSYRRRVEICAGWQRKESEDDAVDGEAQTTQRVFKCHRAGLCAFLVSHIGMRRNNGLD
ncbi:hypothetical protein FB45DRAFT_887218, partial [Roridomyces roridus]